MSGRLMNLFRKNTKLESTQQMALPKKYSSSEDIYEAVDHVDESAPLSPSSGDYEWSDNEFEDEEDIYTNDSELLQTPAVKLSETPEAPVLPPRPRGQIQVEQSTPSLPPRTMTSNPLTSKTASSTPDKPTLSQQDSNDSTEPYEEFSEESHDNKSHDSGDEDYEKFDSTLVSSRSSPLPTPLSAQPTPSLPSRSNRPCPPPPTDQGQPSEDTYVDNDTTAKQDGGIFSKMASAFKQKNIFHLPINLSIRPTNVKQAEISDDYDTYKVEDTPLKPTKYLSPLHPKSLPKPPDIGCDQDDFLETYEITDVSPTLPTGPKPIVNDRKIPGSSLEAKKLPALPAAKVIDLPADQMTEPKWNKLKLPDPDSEEDSRNSELKVKSSPAPSTRNIPMKPKIRANIQDESSKMIKEETSESEPTVKKNRLIPYTPVIPKSINVNDSDGKPKCSFLMKNLPPNKITSPSEFTNEIKTGDSDITSSGNSKSNITQIKSNYLKPIPLKIQIKKSSESGESNSLEISNNPSKNNNPGHIPPKLRVPRPGVIDSEKSKDEILTSSDFPILLDAKNKLRSLVNTLNTEQDDDKKKTSELTSKSSNHQNIAPVVHMPQNKLPPGVPESKVQKDYQEKKTFATDEKVAKHSDVGHVSRLMNKFEQNSPTNKTNQSFAVGKNVYPVSKISPFTNGASQIHKIRLSEQNNNIIDVKDKMVNTTKTKHDDMACKGRQPKTPKANSELKLEIKNKSTENKGISKVSEMKGKLFEIGNKNDDKFCNEKQTKTAMVKLEIEAKTTEQPDKPTKPCVPRKYSNSPKSPVIPRDQERIMSSDDLNNCSWYVPDASRVVADKKLRLIGENGAFLIRTSQKGLTPYSISVFQSGRIFNLQIRRREDNKYAIGSVKPDEKSFSSLIDLVSFHLSNPIEIQGAGEKVYLRHPPTQ